MSVSKTCWCRCFVVEQTAFCVCAALWIVVETCEQEVHLPTAHIQQAEGSSEWNSSAHHWQKLVFLCLVLLCCCAISSCFLCHVSVMSPRGRCLFYQQEPYAGLCGRRDAQEAPASFANRPISPVAQRASWEDAQAVFVSLSLPRDSNFNQDQENSEPR